jgi:hypothetical protein
MPAEQSLQSDLLTFIFIQIIVTRNLFYDAPTPPDGIFDDFLAIPATSTDISTRSLLSLVQSTPIGNIPTR